MLALHEATADLRRDRRAVDAPPDGVLCGGAGARSRAAGMSAASRRPRGGGSTQAAGPQWASPTCFLSWDAIRSRLLQRSRVAAWSTMRRGKAASTAHVLSQDTKGVLACRLSASLLDSEASRDIWPAGAFWKRDPVGESSGNVK